MAKQRKQDAARDSAKQAGAPAGARHSSTQCALCPDLVTYPAGGASAALSEHYTARHLQVITGAAQPS